MPTSWYQAIPHILEMVQSENPSSILDIGVGFGKYGLLLRDMLELPFERYHKQQWKLKLDGVEVFSEYKNPIHDYIYDQIYYNNIIDIVDKLSHYDVILMIDILEHFNKEEGLSLIAKLLKRTKKCLIVSTPLYPADIKAYLGNEYDQHKSRWWELDFVNFDVVYKFIPIGTNGAYIVKIFPTKHHGSYPVRELNYSSNQIITENRPLNIGYILPHKKLTGGLKLLLEQMRQLKQRGHNIIVLFRGNKGESVIPEWSNLIVDKEILVPINQSYVNYIQGCDIVVAGWFEQLPELAQSKVPVLYLEQGHEFLFGEFVNTANYLKIRQYLRHCYSQPCAIAAVSPLISKLLYVRYNRNAPVLTNGIDTDFYHPAEPPNDNIILLVGNPNLRFKGFDVALRALENLWRAGYRFKVNWISQVYPQIHGEISYPINFNIMPSQEELALFYRKADVFLFTSWYEGFGMPPLEAMASGVPVVATQCGGIEVYAQPGFNSLLADPGDNQSLAGALAYLLEDEQARKLLSIRGRKTALQFQWSNVIQQLEGYLYDLVLKKNKVNGQRKVK